MLLARYCNFVIERSYEPLISIESWKQKVYVQANGDVRETITLNATALRDRVYFFRLKAGSGWDQPERYRRNVKVIARSITVNGTPGPRLNVTSFWETTQKMSSFLHLHHAIRRGERVLFEVARTWPAKCLPLVRGEADEFTFYTTRLLEIQHIECTITLPAGLDAVYELVGSAKPNVQLWADRQLDQENRNVFTFCANKIPAHTSVGIRVELK